MADGDLPGEWDSLETSPQGQCLNRVCSQIIDLDLSDIGANVWIRDFPTLDDGTHALIEAPAIVLSPFTPTHDPAAGTVSAPDLNANVMLGIYTGGLRASAASLPNRLYWWHKLFTAMSKNGCPWGVDSALVDGVQCIATNIQPGDLRVIEAWRLLGTDAAWMSVTCWLRYPGAA
jgi:hypothetical protein